MCQRLYRDDPAARAAHGDTISFAIAAQHVSYSGVMTMTGDSVRGTFMQGSVSIPLTFGRSTEGSMSVGRPQDPKPPYPYHTKEVTVPSDGEVRLAGTVVIPVDLIASWINQRFGRGDRR